MFSSVDSYHSLSLPYSSFDDAIMEPDESSKSEESMETIISPLLEDYPDIDSPPLMGSDEDIDESIADLFKNVLETKSNRTLTSKKTGRSFIPQTANVNQTPEDKKAGTCSDKTVINHAGERVVNFRLVAECINKLNITSTGEKRNLIIRIVSALYQGGKGTANDDDVKYHGAHDAADSGLLINAREHFIARILEMGEITPNTKGFMKMRGVSDAEFKLIEACLTEKDIRGVFNVIWPTHPRQPDYLFEGTKLNEKVNRTTELLIGINLFVDKKLEAYIRPIIIELYQKVIDGELSPKEAEKEYVKDITYFFTKLEKNLNLSLSLIDEYQKEFTNIDFNNLEAEKCRETLRKLSVVMEKLCPKKPKRETVETTETKPVKRKKKAAGKRRKAPVKKTATTDETKSVKTSVEPETKAAGVDESQPDAKMINPRMNREFVKKNNPKKDNPELLPTMLKNVQNWGNRRGPELLNEMQTFYNKVSSYVKFVALEKEGTAELTDDQTLALFGEFNPLTGKRELTDETIKAACERLWKAPSPVKKLVRVRDENKDPNIRAGKRPRKGVRLNLKDKFEKMS